MRAAGQVCPAVVLQYAQPLASFAVANNRNARCAGNQARRLTDVHPNTVGRLPG